MAPHLRAAMLVYAPLPTNTGLLTPLPPLGLEPPPEPPDALLRGLSLGSMNRALPDVADARTCGPANVLLRPPAEPCPARDLCCLLLDEPGV
jgi:hypothetical protein